MYIRYPNPVYISRSLVRDVRFFSVEQTDAPDDEEGDFYAICDASIEPATHYCNDIILSLSSYLLGGDEKVLVGGVKYRDDVLHLEPDESMKELAYFNSPEAALKVFNRPVRKPFKRRVESCKFRKLKRREGQIFSACFCSGKKEYENA